MKVGILGAGNIATSMATAINGLDDSIELYAVASRDMAKSQAFADKWGVKVAYGSYEDMLKDDKVDLVYIATPHSHHYAHAKLCLDHGKNTLIEKSFTANARQAEEILEIAEKKNLLMTEAIWTRYMPSRKLIEDLISSGIIGEVATVFADLSYPISHIRRTYDPELAGGALLDLGVYSINFASMFLGDKVKKLSGTCTYFDTGVDSSDSICIEYEGNILANLTASFLSPSGRLGMICGSKGYITVTNINNPEKIEVYGPDHNLIKEALVPSQVNGYEYEVIACQKALSEGRIECNEMPHKETIRIMKQMDELRAMWGIKYPFE
ncbi:MAG: Gfo/Idh/MocA family oxidoreductase [Lachnospiraceae bacterium]|nr:Gfo/Idh/MocA family oxidoreductase [Lachnospiraceae bacterium]MBO7599736.1 Gfo/Idh/MocA family oxidoreductase [Lachnospiraceae bacterium]